ncbi:MAG TPA: hypothetical protein VNI01_16355 [Elusimicrobiota bacterium]|jgi:hypothetical protein|nr:hypothetical protein [Elusimicrobiota bacterium]
MPSRCADLTILTALAAVIVMALIAEAGRRGGLASARGAGAPEREAPVKPSASPRASSPRADSARPARPAPLSVAGPPETAPETPKPALDAAEGATYSYYGGADAAGMCLSETPERHSVYAALGRLYSTADVDPLIAGNLYRYADGVRRVYSQRTSLEDRQGLTEYNSSAEPGDVGVDVGPAGLDKDPAASGADDGIPENWRFPSTPVRWYRPRQRDYYGPEGPTSYADGLYELTEPDHDPKMP